MFFTSLARRFAAEGGFAPFYPPGVKHARESDECPAALPRRLPVLDTRSKQFRPRCADQPERP